MGEVYLANDPRLRREVAIKVLPADRAEDEERRRRFLREARAASALNHPNIVTIHEVGSADGIDFIVMEHVPGKTLDALIPRHGMRLTDVLKTAIPIADALAKAHTRGIVHRDLKPANVVVSTEGVVKVLDFGLAKIGMATGANPTSETATDDGERGPLSGPRAVAGTLGYMSPEQARGDPVDSRTDVFSFGAVLYELATGRRAFPGNSTAEVLANLLRDQPGPPGDLAALPKDLQRVILRCLQGDPERRFQNMLDVKLDLQEIREQVEADSGSASSSVVRSRRQWTGTWVGGGMLALALLFGSSWYWRTAVIPPPIIVPLTFTPGDERSPTFSPDGTQVAFEWDGGVQGGSQGIYIKLVGSTETRRIAGDHAESPSWSPDGRQIAFVRRARRGESGSIRVVSPLGGSDRKLGEFAAGASGLAWSPDGRWLVTGADGRASEYGAQSRGISLVNASDGTVRQITFPSLPAYHAGPRFSPDGRSMAYASCRSFYSCQVEVAAITADYRLDNPQRLTRRAIWMGGLAWAADGRSVVYNDRLSGRLFRVGVLGTTPSERLEIAGGASVPDIAKVGHRLVFERYGFNLDVYKFEIGRPPTAVAPSSADERNPDFSPDGRLIAFESTRAGEGSEIWVSAPDGTSPVQLTHGPGRWQGSPRWSPDGQTIAFDAVDEDGQWDIWIVDKDGGARRRMTSDPFDENMPSWSSNGHYLYFSSNRSGEHRIWRTPTAGGPAEQVSHTGGGRSAETRDGKMLFFGKSLTSQTPLLVRRGASAPEETAVACVDGPSGFAVGGAGVYYIGCGASPRPLYLMDPVTRQSRLLGKLEKGEGAVSASPDGRTVLYTRDVGGGGDLMLIENFR
jgi:serine/threonine protein kinase